MTPDIASARTRFRDAALAYWVCIQSSDSDAANEETDKGDKIMREWEQHGDVLDLLAPLLNDSDPEVRFAAASHLIGRDVPAAISTR